MKGAGARPKRPQFDAVLVAILLIAALTRAAVILAAPHYVPVNDAADYDHYAVSLATHAAYPSSALGGPTAFRPPGFPVLLALIYKLVGVGSASARCGQDRASDPRRGGGRAHLPDRSPLVGKDGWAGRGRARRSVSAATARRELADV